MKEYAYYIPGYTGFCPDLRDHFGQTYGSATRHILKEKPHLKERLAPVFYRGKKWGKNGKKFDHLTQHDRDGADSARHKEEYEDKARCSKECNQKEKRHDRAAQTENKPRFGKPQERCKPDHFEGKAEKPRVSFQHQMRERRDYGDGDTLRAPEHLCYCPSYVYVQSFAECCPTKWEPQEGADAYHVHYPQESTHGSRHSHDHSGHGNHCHSKLKKVPQVRPHREAGVIPNYAGHIPGLLFSFGESYGPASCRLLRRHHDNMRNPQRK